MGVDHVWENTLIINASAFRKITITITKLGPLRVGYSGGAPRFANV